MQERFLHDEALRLEQAARRAKSPSKRRMLESHALFYRVVAASGSVTNDATDVLRSHDEVQKVSADGR